MRAATADSESNYSYDTGIYCHEGAINPSAIITKREWIRRADRQDVAS